MVCGSAVDFTMEVSPPLSPGPLSDIEMNRAQLT